MSACGATRSGPVGEYVSHPFHGAGRDWPESNCYIDLWIEILHRAGLTVEAMLPFTVAADFEGDQWSFYKPPHSDLTLMYGIDVLELSIWKPLEAHCAEQVARGRIPLVEMDAYYLPDTAGRDYRSTHTKTTIGIATIDPDRETLRYFHNRGLFDLDGEDYRGLFAEPGPESLGSGRVPLPPFCEIAKLDRVQHNEPAVLRAHSLELLRQHRSRVPASNPIEAHAASVEHDLERLIASDPEQYDDYAFAGIRQCGSSFGFTADYLRWLADGDSNWLQAADAFARISSTASMLVLKMARIAHSGRIQDLSEPFARMAESWQDGLERIDVGLENWVDVR